MLKIPQSGNQRLHVGTGLDERVDSFLTDIAVINGGNTRERLDIFVVSGQKLGVFRLDRLTNFGSLLQVLVELGVKFSDVIKARLHDLVAAGAFFVEFSNAKEILEGHSQTSAQEIDRTSVLLELAVGIVWIDMKRADKLVCFCEEAQPAKTAAPKEDTNNKRRRRFINTLSQQTLRRH